VSEEGFWFYLAGEQRQGPVTLEELVAVLRSAPDPHNVLVWCAGMPEWQAAGFVPEINRRLPPPSPSVQPRAVAGGGVSFETAEKVARLYRRLVLLVGLQILLGCLVRVPLLGTSPSTGAAVIALAGTLVLIGVLVALAVTAYHLTESLGESMPILWAIAMFIPCVNIITLLVLSSKAQAWCRLYGIKVGFLGPDPESIEELRRRGVTSKFE
jgi:GYF domain 2